MSMGSDCFAIGGNASRVCTEYNSGIFPESRPDYFFYNIGKTNVLCQAIYGTAFSWIGPIGGRVFYPGDSGNVSTGGRPYYVTGQKCINQGSSRGLVHCRTTNGGGGGDDSGPGISIDINAVGKKLVTFGAGKIPYVGAALSGIIEFFWPDNQPSVWDQIKDQVNDVVDNKIRQAIQAILGGDIRYYKERISVLKNNLDDPNSHDNNIAYMRIAEDLVGFEQKFRFTPQDHSDYVNINYYVLPLYSSLVNLKVLFYSFGINNQSKIRLTDNNIYNLKTYLKRVIEDKDGASYYIPKVFDDMFNKTYNSCNPSQVYDALATVRTWCAINGLEFLPIWKAIVNDPTNTKKPYNDVISYSTHFCRSTPYFTRQIVTDNIQVPLQPKLINGKRNRMTKVDVWIFRIRGGTPKINGIKIYYENGDTVTGGSSSNETNTVDFKGANLKSLTAWGNGALDMLEFELSDGRKQNCGENKESWGKHQKFELANHHIVGILVTNDELGLAGQSCSIGVSYQLDS